MASYIRIDDKEDLDWLKKVISNWLATDPNHPRLLLNYKFIAAWEQYLAHAIPAKEVAKDTAKPETLLTEADVVKTAPPKPRRGRPPSKKTTTKTRAKKKPVEAPDPYVCPTHPKYTAKRRPQGECTKCWELFKTFNPMRYDLARADYERSKKYKAKSATG